MKGFLQLLLGVLLVVSGKWLLPDNLGSDFISSGLVLISSLIVLDGSFFIVKNWNRIKLLLQSINPFVRKELRISIAYLMRIEVNGKYLLVRNDRGQSGFQPVGGVYRYFYPEGYKELQELGVFTDNNIERDEHSEHDLRCVIENRSKLLKFLNWFDREQNRELDPWREFYEELVTTSIVPEALFRYFQYEKVGVDSCPIKYSEHFKIYEYLYADIFRPKFSDEQLTALKNLQRNGHSDILFATRDEIMQGNSGVNQILPHSKKIFKTL